MYIKRYIKYFFFQIHILLYTYKKFIDKKVLNLYCSYKNVLVRIHVEMRNLTQKCQL